MFLEWLKENASSDFEEINQYVLEAGFPNLVELDISKDTSYMCRPKAEEDLHQLQVLSEDGMYDISGATIGGF